MRVLSVLKVAGAVLLLGGATNAALGGEYGFNDFFVDSAEEILRPEKPFAEMTPPAEPDYAMPESWSAFPGRSDGADDSPLGYSPRTESDREADVFFVHPATFITPEAWNGPAHDRSLPMKEVDQIVLQNMASAFNACCRVFAPRYRQATMYAMMTPTPDSRLAIELAYSDVRRAFAYFREHENKGRPFILASHSQGGWHLMRLLALEIQGTEAEKQFVAGYFAGYMTPTDVFERTLTTVHPCKSPTDTGCVAVWNTFGPDGNPRFQRARIEHFYSDHYELIGDKPIACVNPVTWAADGAASPTEKYLGTATFGPITGLGASFMEGTISAKCDEGMLKLDRSGLAHFISSSGFPEDDTHPYDFSLFYMDIRANAVVRTQEWVKRNGAKAQL
jgi:hypothetical protein